MSLHTIIRSMVSDMINPEICIGKILSVDESNYTCMVDLGRGPKLSGVRIRATIEEVTTGILVIPKINSYVVVAKIENHITSSVILVYSDVEKIELKPSEEIKLFGDSHGGLVINGQVESNLDQIKQYLSGLNSAISSALNAVGVGNAANGPGAAQVFNTAMQSQSINYSDMESKNVKHG